MEPRLNISHLQLQYRQEVSSSWDGQPFGHNRHGSKIGGAVPILGGDGPHLTQCRLGRDLPLYQVQTFNYFQSTYRNNYYCWRKHQRVDQSASLLVHNLTSLQAVQSASWVVRELGFRKSAHPPLVQLLQHFRGSCSFAPHEVFRFPQTPYPVRC